MRHTHFESFSRSHACGRGSHASYECHLKFISSMYRLDRTGSDVTNYLITGSDVITLISCRFTVCFPTGSDVTNYLITGSDVITLISCRFTACFPTGSDVTNYLITGSDVQAYGVFPLTVIISEVRARSFNPIGGIVFLPHPLKAMGRGRK